MENLILILIVAGIVGGAGYYIYREKKKGATCIGCPYAKKCQKHNCTDSCLGDKINDK